MFKKMAMVMVMVMMFCMVGMANALTVNEEAGDWGMITFTVNNEYENIVEFAVGNNDAKEAEVWWENQDRANLSNGYLATRTNEGWHASYSISGEVIRDVDWMNELVEFSDYDYAFLFTSWSEEEGNEYWGAYLELGETTGYVGHTKFLGSPFAAYRTDGSVVIGETTHSAVPIPGAVWLLGSGLIGLVGIRRKNNKGDG